MSDEVSKLLGGQATHEFLERVVKPKEEDISRLKSEVNQFVLFLHDFSTNSKTYTVDRVVLGGSTGKGTGVRGKADIDLEVVINEVKSISDLERQRPAILNEIEEAAKHYDWDNTIRKTKRNAFSVQYRLNGVDIDVLPVFDVQKHIGGRAKIQAEMEKYPGGVEKAAKQYSASLSEFQIEAVKPLDSKIKNVIRLLKFWKKGEGLDSMPSYCMELLALHECRNRTSQPIDVLFRRCMGKLTCCHDIAIVFDTSYSSVRSTRGRNPPFIMDPANPNNDTLSGVNIREVSLAGNKYFRMFYENNPEAISNRQKRGLSATKPRPSLQYL